MTGLLRAGVTELFCVGVAELLCVTELLCAGVVELFCVTELLCAGVAELLCVGVLGLGRGGGGVLEVGDCERGLVLLEPAAADFGGVQIAQALAFTAQARFEIAHSLLECVEGVACFVLG